MPLVSGKMSVKEVEWSLSVFVASWNGEKILTSFSASSQSLCDMFTKFAEVEPTITCKTNILG